MHISEQGLALIKRCEGFSATPYLCPAGKSTIGYGHVITAGEEYPADGISESQAEVILNQDVTPVEQVINQSVQVTLNQNQFDALAVFIYNIGAKAFEKSTLLRVLNAGDMQGVISQWGRWVYGGGQVLTGLVARRTAETELFMTDSSGVA